MIPKRQLLRCTKLFGKCIIWMVLIVNVVILANMFSGGKLVSHTNLHQTQLFLGGRGLYKFFPTPKPSIENNDTVDVSPVTESDGVDGSDVTVEKTSESQKETTTEERKKNEEIIHVAVTEKLKSIVTKDKSEEIIPAVSQKKLESIVTEGKIEEKIPAVNEKKLKSKLTDEKIEEKIPTNSEDKIKSNATEKKVVIGKNIIKEKVDVNKKETFKNETVVDKKENKTEESVQRKVVSTRKIIAQKGKVSKKVVEKKITINNKDSEPENITLVIVNEKRDERIIAFNESLRKIEKIKNKEAEEAKRKKVETVKCSGKNATLDICTNKTVNSNTPKTLVNQTLVAPVSKDDEWYKKKWQFNASAAKGLRDKLESEFHNRDIFVTSKKTVILNGTLIYEAEPAKRLLITSQVYNVLPDTSPYDKKTFKKCSVVGNSGIILGSKCGKLIDQSDFVIRMNLPDLYNYTEDVGSRTDLVTCNPTLARSKYGGLKIEEDKQRFIDDLKEFQNASLLMPAFSYKVCTEPSFRVYGTLKPTGRDVIFTNPDHMFLARQYWTERGVDAIRLSSGMLLFTAALGMCEEVHLYGFWPFKVNMDGKRVYYHYFDKDAYMLNKKKIAMHWHEMPQEFKLLKELHQKGAIHMQVTQCAK